MAMTHEQMQALLARARANVAAANAEKLSMLEAESAAGTVVDLTVAGIPADLATSDDAQLDAAADILNDILAEPDAASDTVHADTTGVARTDITYNAKQQEYVDAVVSGIQEVVLVGAAGTGKTTCQRGAMEGLIASGRAGVISSDTKWLRAGLPGAVVVSYTNKAVNNIRHAMPEILKPHTVTIHKLLEFQPVFYEIEDPAHPGEFKKTMRFEPSRTRHNPLPSSLRFIGFEEASMVDTNLYAYLMDAMPHKHQRSFLGDIHQLPPIFGSAILGYKMLESPVIELTEIYRQAAGSPIISLAWDIKDGKVDKFSSKVTKRTKVWNASAKKELERIEVGALDAYNVDGKLKLHYLQKKINSDLALMTLTKQFNVWADDGFYDSTEDMILMPFNKAFGTVEMNKGLMQHLGVKRNALVHEIRAGFNLHYLAEGDRVLYAKEDAIITSITRNGEFTGKGTQAASSLLDRWGHIRTPEKADDAATIEKETIDEGFDIAAIDKMLASAADATGEDRVNQASHVVIVKLKSTDEEFELETAAEINNLLGGYALTIHKAQGSEWERVFIIMHNSHAVMNLRELLYTAVTRARSFLYFLCETDTLEKGVKAQRIPGNTFEEKLVTFKRLKEEADAKQALLDKADTEGIRETPKMIRLADMVPTATADAIKDKTAAVWKQALALWPHKVTELGTEPTVGFEIRSRNIVGKVRLSATPSINYNPVFLSSEDPEVLSYIMNTTVIHEVCHVIAYKVYKEAGHGFWWKDCMRKMGVHPSRLAEKEMPSYMTAKNARLAELFKHHDVTVSTTDVSDNDVTIGE